MATKETTPLNPRAIFSKTGKGVQEASGKTSHLSRGDRAVLKEIDGKTTLADIALKFEKIPADKFDALIALLDKDGFVREVSSGAAEPIAPIRKVSPAAPPKATPKPAGNAGDGLDFSKAAPPPKGGDDMDFTSFAPSPSKPAAPPPPKGPAIDLAAAARAEADKKAKEQAATDYRSRQEAEAKAAAEAKARAEAEAKARAAAEATKAEAEARARAADSEAKAKQARDMALRMASEAKAKAEAEAKDKARLEAELKAKLDEERKAREEAEKRAAEAAERARKELEEKTKREAEELRQRLEAEMKAKLEEERRAREEEDRKRREEEERRRKEERERHEKELAERRAKEEAERKQREEEDRKRREEEERRRKEERERHEKEIAEARAKEEAERKRRAKEEDERRAKEEEERKRRAREEDERRARDEEDRKRRGREDDDRRAREDSERRAKEESERKARESASAAPAASAPSSGGGGLGDSLLADLDSFTQRDEEERKAKEEAERKEKEETARRAREEEERRRREAEEKKRREEEERRAKEEAERKAKEEEERRAREDQERRQAEEEERKRKAKEALEKKQAEQRAAEQKAGEATLPPRSKAPARPAGKDDDIGVSDDDLDMDDVRRDEGKVSKEARQAAREREQVQAVSAKRPVKWGKPVAIAVFVVLVGGIGALQVMPLSTSDYEKAASEALGVPVKVSSARLSVITGVQVNLSDVTVGDVKIRLVRGYPEVGSLFGAKKSFNRIELEGASVSQAQLGEAFFGKAGGPNFRVGRIVAKGLKADGPLTLPALDIDATVGGEGALQSINIAGPDKLAMKLTPNGNEIAFEASAASFTIPFVPAFSLSDFGWKGSANRQGVASSEFDGRQFDGLISGTARIRWGSSWTVEGEVRARNVKVAVFAPALVSGGKVEARGNYTMSGPSPAKLGESAHVDGSFKIENGIIGNFALRRALETGGAQTGGSTEFTELTGQGVYDKGAVQLRNMNIGAGAMSAGANLDIEPGGNLAGRIAAEVKTPSQALRAVLNVSGTVQNPVIRK